jgi:hypothetical protein
VKLVETFAAAQTIEEFEEGAGTRTREQRADDGGGGSADPRMAVMTAHPWAPMLVVSRISVGPGMLHYIDATLDTLREAGLSWLETDRAWNAMDNYIHGFASQQ